jgi:hypothetical protein
LFLLALTDLSLTFAGENVRGPVRVCRKPMLAGNASMAALANPGPDALRQLAERQAEEAKYCYTAGDIELAEKGPEIDVGLNTKCTEWQAIANGDRVFVVIGSRGTWGSCP